ncbi:MAG: MFS transporter [Candidatus Electrothrix sp. ATG2]|nr:MFS transporter [Candidatus Electrothrix sp. ATG2]
MAVGNGAGRIVAGILSDKIGRKITLFSCFVIQALTIFLLSQAEAGNVLGSSLVLGILSVLIGANYGANLSLFPSITKDYYGIRNFGVNYGLVFTSWGLGGFTLSLLAGQVYDRTQTFTFAYYCSAALLIAAALMALCLKPVQQKL